MRRRESFILEDMNLLQRNHVSLSVCSSLASTKKSCEFVCLYITGFSYPRNTAVVVIKSLIFCLSTIRV